MLGKCSGILLLSRPVRAPQDGVLGTVCTTNLRTATTSLNIGSDWGPNCHRYINSPPSLIRAQRSLSSSLLVSMLSWMLRTDASAIPIEIACPSLPGITLPSNRQSKKRSARILGDRAPAIPVYQILSATNRTVENITSGSVTEWSIHEMQRASAVQTSQSIEMSPNIRAGDTAIAATGI